MNQSLKARIGKTILLAPAAALLVVSMGLPASAQEAAAPSANLTELKVTDLPIPAGFIPKGYEEGYLPKLSEIDIKEIEQFARNSYEDLKDLLDVANKTTDYWEKREILKTGIDGIITKSKPLKTELLMRNVLERAVIMVNLIDVEVQNDLKRKGIVDQEVRLMKESIRMSMQYWEPYLRHVNGQTVQASVDLSKINYRRFGVDYSNLLWSIANSIFDASAEYKLRIEALKLLMWDLYRDENKLETNQAGAISKIYNFLKHTLDPSGWSDDQFVEKTKMLRTLRNEVFGRLGKDPGTSPAEAARVAQVAKEQAARAAEIARTQAPKPTMQYDLDAYRKALNYSTNSCSAINDAQAQSIARYSMNGELTIGVFIDIYNRTCSVSNAIAVAQNVKNGSVDHVAFQSTMGHSTNSCSAINYAQALEISKLVARGLVSLKDFVDLYDRNCNYVSARNLATKKQ